MPVDKNMNRSISKDQKRYAAETYEIINQKNGVIVND